jgi:hypothetical protein
MVRGRHLTATAVASSLFVALAAASAFAGGKAKQPSPPSPPAVGQVAMSVQPSETLVVAGGESKTLTLTNTGSITTKYFMAVGNFDVDANGGVRIDPPLTPSRSARQWLRVDPAETSLRPGQAAKVRIRAVPGRSARPGDHGAIVLFTTDVADQGTARLRGRIGVPMIVRVNGPLVRKVSIGRIQVRKSGKTRVIRARVFNNGNVSERFTRQRILIEIRRSGRTVARVASRTRLLLPGTNGDVVARYSGKVRGRVTIRVTLIPASPPEAGPRIATTPRAVVRSKTVQL